MLCVSPKNPYEYVRKYTFTIGVFNMKDQTIKVKNVGLTNPAREGFVAVTSASEELGSYLRKANNYPNLSAEEEKEIALNIACLIHQVA